ncbi:T9SS type A sorting domain-containing protein [Pseudoflavitalea sp. G-6-1-2]|uniref:T9SS type A sorting domain-containing protein n=1 Tax=Pseudoflavitalea sp. G-6-1-2 TaxID=2728841 RepID=UPI00146C9C10|nr:T9SS type A sorting domain-containing protein [Pseudoflavitalea sp. G-6-1-2]NML22610.1 T9SS type A sorting domain-containing protein [Pseudoflavitalea sp. G-6-1-2]
MNKIYLNRILLLMAMLLSVSMYSNAQIAAWDFTGENTVATSDAEVFNANLDASKTLTRGTGAAASAGANSFRTVGFKNDGISTANTDYFQFTLSASPGYTLSLSTIDAKFAGTATFAVTPGVSSQFAYSLDGTNFTLIASPVATVGTPATLPQVDLSSISALQNVPDGTTITFRYYASGQTATGGWGFNSPSAGQYGLSIGGSLTASVPSPVTSSISPSSATAGAPAFPLTVIGSNFVNGASTVTWNGASRPTVFVSATELTATIAAADIAATGSFLVGVTTTGASSPSNTQTFTVNPGTSPVVTVAAPLPVFGNVCVNTTAGPNSFKIDGSSLNGTNITIDALPGFSYSETSGGAYAGTLSFSYVGSSFTGKEIFVKFNPTAVQSYSGNINISGGGVTGVSVAASGTGVNAVPTVTTGGSSAVTGTTATVASGINDAGCSPVTDYGIEYSTASGFPNGSGTKVSASNLSGGNYSVNLSGLSPNTRYYYKAYATNGGGTAYGSQQAFTNTALPVVMSAQPGLSYTQTFDDIASWGNFFTSGNGANHFSGLSAGGSGAIPNATVTTASTSNFQSNLSSGGVQRGTDQTPASQSIVLLSTGGTDNTSAAALDFYMDFTGLNAGTLSFDWASIDNSTGNRNGSVRVYATTDGVSFTELTFANVLNFTNNAATSGSKNNIALPAIFNNSATARLRFYYHNGTGGTTGSRPKLSIDNLTVTAVATTPCLAPTAAPTALAFGTINDVSIQGSFTAAAPAADGYLVVASTSNSLTSNPVNGQIYSVGDNVGDGTVVSNGSSVNFTASGLNASTTYYFFIFSVNSICTGGPLYYTTTALTGQATTNAGLPPCAAPASQPTGLVFGTATPTSIQGSFTAATADEYLVLRSSTSTLSNNPVNGQTYNAGDLIGTATVVQRSNSTSFTASGLTPNTGYYFFVFSIGSQNCVGGPAYNTVNPLTASQSTAPLPPCATPVAQPVSLALNATNTSISGSFTAASGADDYLVIRSTTSTLSANPANNVDYNVGDNLGGGIVVSNSAATNFVATGLSANTVYYFFVFSANRNCIGGTKYLITNPLKGNKQTTNTPPNNIYFGTLHAHSDYSDGNQDNPGFTPADDYNYAMNSDCMDFLGISEHNHFSTANNPGNQISNYHSGSVQANNFSAAHPNFLALYGMEWGVISGGGHVLIYGDGMDLLFGWESGSGTWGAGNNYDVYVAKSDYTGANGLFKTINDYAAQNTFASLAHPNFTDYNNLANAAYNPVADEAIVGTAVESGPASSTNTTYSDPASPMSYLNYYQALLAKGYHLGPTIDHDNHKTTFGRTTRARTAVIAPALTKTEIIKAIRNMQYYATHDCDSKVDFSINARIMGAVFTDRNAPVISVTLTDATTNVSNAVINIMHGIPGSGVAAQKIASVTGSSITYADVNLANHATGYYYIDITNGTARIITSPIWYTRDDLATLPLQLVAFTVQKQQEAVQLNWTTSQEVNTKSFIVERSINNGGWEAVGTVAAKGKSANYNTMDAHPAKGLNVYRLKMIDQDGAFSYSDLRRVNFNTSFVYNVYPNPARSFLHITTDNLSAAITVEVLNVHSQLLITKKYADHNSKLELDISRLTPGVYFLKILSANGSSHMEKFVKQ